MIIELDGVTHINNKKKDKRKQTKLQELGFTILRFGDKEICEELTLVKMRLEKWIDEYERKNSEVLTIKNRKKHLSPVSFP